MVAVDWSAGVCADPLFVTWAYGPEGVGMMGKSLAASLALAALSLAIGAPAALAAGEIGNVELIREWAWGTAPEGVKETLYRTDPVVTDELVETIVNGALHLEFLDQTELRLGSASQATLDSFVYDPATRAGEMVVDLGEGVFRFITGKLNKQNIQLRTPVALIGIRGTDLVVRVTADGTTTVYMFRGSCVVTALRGGKSAGLGVAMGASVDPTGKVTEGVGPPEFDVGLADTAGGLPASESDGGKGQDSNSP